MVSKTLIFFALIVTAAIVTTPAAAVLRGAQLKAQITTIPTPKKLGGFQDQIRDLIGAVAQAQETLTVAVAEGTVSMSTVASVAGAAVTLGNVKIDYANQLQSIEDMLSLTLPALEDENVSSSERVANAKLAAKAGFSALKDDVQVKLNAVTKTFEGVGTPGRTDEASVKSMTDATHQKVKRWREVGYGMCATCILAGPVLPICVGGCFAVAVPVVEISVHGFNAELAKQKAAHLKTNTLAQKLDSEISGLRSKLTKVNTSLAEEYTYLRHKLELFEQETTDEGLITLTNNLMKEIQDGQ